MDLIYYMNIIKPLSENTMNIILILVLVAVVVGAVLLVKHFNKEAQTPVVPETPVDTTVPTTSAVSAVQVPATAPVNNVPSAVSAVQVPATAPVNNVPSAVSAVQVPATALIDTTPSVSSVSVNDTLNN
jgi:hypothetical protein